jgi:hypothetical protein
LVSDKLPVDTEQLEMDWQFTFDLIKAIGGSVAIIAAPLAYVQYRRSVKTKRAEWLESLHEKFFETERYAEVRRVLDYAEQPAYDELAAAVSAGIHHRVADDLWRYLNFFELLAGLRQLKQISDKEIVRLFDYDLRLMKRQEFIMNALEPEGFDGLDNLLKTVRLEVTKT